MKMKLHPFLFLSLLLLLIASPVSGAGNTWCVAKPDADKARLQAALDYACGEEGADFRPIQPGAACYTPNTMVAHASFAFNSYYQRRGRAACSCYFAGLSSPVTEEPRGYHFPAGP